MRAWRRWTGRVQSAPVAGGAVAFASSFLAGRTVVVHDAVATDVVVRLVELSRVQSIETLSMRQLFASAASAVNGEAKERVIFVADGGDGEAARREIVRRDLPFSPRAMIIGVASTAANASSALAALRTRFEHVRCFGGRGDDQAVFENDPDALSPDAAWYVVTGTSDERWSGSRLHIGCGPLALPGWINVDNQPYAAVDFLWDLSAGLPLARSSLVFAEHFIEHLPYGAAARFIRACRQSLRPDGVLRLSTPNLDWVWAAVYRPDAWTSPADAQRDCFWTNRAFRGWGHHFLYNQATLAALLHNGGFSDVSFHAYGESEVAELRGLERHPRDIDTPELPHVIIAEARGVRELGEPEGAALIAEYERDVATT